MEKKIYEILGIKLYRKFVLFCKSKFNKLTKTEDNDNYFLRGYSKENIIFLKEQFKKNFNIHFFGTIVGLFLLIVFLLEAPISMLKVGLAIFVFLLNGYSCMLQRYNLLKVNRIINTYF